MYMNNYHEILFDSALYLSYLFYFVAFFQLKTYNPEYLVLLQSGMKYYVISFLLIRFNPFTRVRFTEFDRKVVFSSAIFLLTTTVLDKYSRDLDLVSLVKVAKLVR
jgi:hypothetical protein